MDFSINNKIKRANNINFQGVKGLYNKKNEPVFKFVPPMYDPEKETAYLELVFLERNSATGQFAPPNANTPDGTFEFEKDKPLDILQEEIMDYAWENAFAYRYKIVNNENKSARYALDDAKTINIKNSSAKMNVIDMGSNYGITPKGGTMRHSFLDSDAILDKTGNNLLPENKEFVRNHFNKLGGSIKGLNYLLKNGYLDSYRYIISTPDIGVDPTSSHKYWPSNQYQCSNVEDFKEFNYELFKRGKGYVADGAFTSQGIQSPMVQHVLKWGEESPFYNMLKINGRLNLGVLPDRGPFDAIKQYDHIGVKIVNSPKREGYDSKKPTYMQFFDDRMSSPEQQKSNELIKAYDSQPKDHYEIVHHQDSIQPYYFELDPIKDAKKIAKFNNDGIIMLNKINDIGDFLTFPHFSIASKEHATGANFWDGNRDIIKMNLSNPTSNPENKQGLKDAREYLYGVASFWSEMIQSELILRTALEKSSVQEDIAQQNDIPLDFIKNLNLDDMEFPVLNQAKTPRDYVIEFPLQSIETSPELSAIFAQPQFKKEFLNEKTLNLLTNIVNETINSAIPEDFKNDKEYKIYATKAYANSIIKNVLVGAMQPDAINSNGTINLDKLKNVTLKSLQPIEASTVNGERKQIVSKIQKNITPEYASSIQKTISEELKKISLEDFKRAEIIVEQGRGGLNWRFDAAKDIGDLDSVRDHKIDFYEIWDGGDIEGVVDFWSKFINNVRQYNPASYVISEITNLWDFYDIKKGQPLEKFDKGMHQDFVQKYANQENIPNGVRPPYAKEMEFLETVNSTTSSNYNDYFNNLSVFIGVNAEDGKNEGNKGNIGFLKGQVDNLINHAQPNTIILSHMFINNHDKPRLLHAIPLNRALFLRGTLEKCKLEVGEKNDLLGKNFKETDYKRVSSKAYAVGLIMRNAIYNKYNGDDNSAKREALLESLQNLVLGKKDKNSKLNFKRAEAFGTLPYEVTVRDIFKNAGLEINDEEIESFVWELVGSSAWKQEKLVQIMGAITGVPTIYNGDEYAQTGYESSSKNKFVGNRNIVLHSLKDKDNYKAYYNKINADLKMYQEQELSALRDGFPKTLDVIRIGGEDYDLKGVNQGAFNWFVGQIKNHLDKEKIAPDVIFNKIRSTKTDEELSALLYSVGIDNNNNNHANFKKIIPTIEKAVKNSGNNDSAEVLPVYKYNEKGSRVLSLITPLGIDNPFGSVSANSIPLKNCPFEEGVTLKRKVYIPEEAKYIDEPKEYKIKNGAIVCNDGTESVVLNDTVATFYVPKEDNKSYLRYLYNQTK